MYRCLFVLLLIAYGTLGAGCTEDHRAASSVDPWYTPEHPSGSDLSETLGWKRLDERTYWEVEPSRELEAEDMLKTVSCRALSSQEADRLLGKPLRAAHAGEPYLVRGVVFNRGTGRFTLRSKDDELFVRHGSLGHDPVPMMRQCLVVLLGQMPKQVFVTCHMVE